MAGKIGGHVRTFAWQFLDGNMIVLLSVRTAGVFL